MERRSAGAPAHRPARSLCVLASKFFGLQLKAAASAGYEASQDRGGGSAAAIVDWLNRHRHLRAVDGGGRHGGRRAARERRLGRRAWCVEHAALAVVDRCGSWQLV